MKTKNSWKLLYMIPLMFLVACATGGQNLTESGDVTVKILPSPQVQIHGVKVFQEGDKLAIRGHVEPHNQVSPTQSLSGWVHVKITDGRNTILHEREHTFTKRHQDGRHLPDFYAKIPLILPMGSTIQLQYHRKSH
ncbi:MAG: hypothetical protein HQM14_21380 [SAR324 cluster bacterium]|nr:hypothetical protein [SAR324 cluster bacterium]